MDKTEICGLTLGELSREMESLSEKPFRAKQLYQWLHEKFVWEFESMSDLPETLRQRLSERFFITEGQIKEKLTTYNTCKYLFRFENNSIIESVLMKHSFGNTVCVSSQAGCNMGCLFCYSARGGKERDLTAAEMLYQVYAIQKDIGERVSNAVIMGSGEPLDNYANTLRFIEVLSGPKGLNMGQRHITLSTCGLVDKMYDLAREKLQINLAVSLHAPNDEIRKKIMPVAKSYGVDEIIEAGGFYAEQTGRRVTYEYALIKGVNDAPAMAYELGKKLRGRLCHVNMIPVNPVKDVNFTKPEASDINKFAEVLIKMKIPASIRKEMGSGINAACGQLRGRVSP